MKKEVSEELDARIHNIRGPLNSISMNAELVKLLAGGDKLPDDLAQALDTIVRQCAACSDELDALRTYLRSSEVGTFIDS